MEVPQDIDGLQQGFVTALQVCLENLKLYSELNSN